MSTARGPQFKAVLLGEVGVGKTSLFFRIKEDTFTEPSRRTTVGIDSCSRLVPLDKNSHVTFSLWDTAGVERFRTLTRNYYRNTHVSIFMFSLDNPTTLHYLPKWVDDARDFSPKSMKVLIGNKSDLPQTIKPQMIESFADINDIDLTFKISAKTGEGVEEMLDKIARTLMNQKKISESSMMEETIKPNKKESRTHNNCHCNC